MRNKLPIKVLQVTIGDGNYGGVASFLCSYYSRINHDRVHFDFLYCGENSLRCKENDSVLEGSKVVTLHILKRNNNGFRDYMKLIFSLKKFFDENKYDIVHVNSGNVFLNASIVYTLRKRAALISHSHNTAPTIQYGSRIKNELKELIRIFIRSYIIKHVDFMYACSRQAGISLFGLEGIKHNNYKVVKNAIDTQRYRYCSAIRDKLRKNDSDVVIIGFVGRLSDQKNPLFVIEIFREILKIRSDAILWMVGEGELKNDVCKTISNYGLEKKVVLLGRRDDVNDIMQAMDILLFPSMWEGLGIVAIEAQCAGLPVLASDQVPDDANVAGLITNMQLSSSAKEWAEKSIELITCNVKRCDKSDKVRSANYDIFVEAKKLEEEYIRLAQDHKRD